MHSYLEDVEQKIRMKITNLKDERNEKLSQVDLIRKQIEGLKSFKSFEEKTAEAQKMLREGVQKLQESVKDSLAKKIPEKAMSRKHLDKRSHSAVTTELEYMIDEEIKKKIREWEDSTENFAEAKKILVRNLKEHAGQFFESLNKFDTALGAPRLVLGIPQKYVIGADLPLPIAIPAALLCTPIYVGIQGMLWVTEKTGFALEYSKNPAEWRKNYASKKLEEMLTINCLQEKVEELLFSPRFYTESLKAAITQVLDQQELFLKDLTEEQRSCEEVSEALRPLQDRCARIVKKVLPFTEA